MRESKAANRSFFALTAAVRDPEERVRNAGEIRLAIHVALAHDARIDREGVESEVHLCVCGRKEDSLDPGSPGSAWKHRKWNVMDETHPLTVGLRGSQVGDGLGLWAGSAQRSSTPRARAPEGDQTWLSTTQTMSYLAAA